MLTRVQIGVVGAGNISGIYLQNLSSWPETPVVAIADLDDAKAQAAASKFGIEAVTIAELLERGDIDTILNLTVPKAHFDVGMAALRSNKSLYNEKPLALTLAEGRELMGEAALRDLEIGCAPDTVLGAGVQTARTLIEKGVIGELVGMQAFMLCPGHESWHPSPAFYYEQGGGPLFDMGPYYLSAMFHLGGPIEAVTAMARTTRATRLITSEPLAGNTIQVETPTHISAEIRFESGAIAHLATSFDVQAHELPHIEVYGTEGTISVPDPNGFGGPVRMRSKGGEWVDVALVSKDVTNLRGLGLRDWAIHGKPRASGEIGLHVLEAMECVLLSAEAERFVRLESRPERPPIRLR